MIRVAYELDPPQAAETLALVESVGRADGPDEVHRAAIGKFEIGKYVPKELMRSGQ